MGNSNSFKSKSYNSDDDKKKKFSKKKDNSSLKSSSKFSSRNSSKSYSNQKKSSHKANGYILKEMDSKEEVFESEEVAKEQSNEDSGSGMAGIACASTPALKFFDNNSCDVKAPTYCFMEKASKGKVPPKKQKAYASDGFSSSDDDEAKLIKIAKKQQYSLEKHEKSLRKHW